MSARDESQRKRRFYVPDLPAGDAREQPGGHVHVELPQDESHHALNVLRLEIGDEVELFDGTGTVAAGKIAKTTRNRAEIKLAEVRKEPRPGPAVHLAFAVPKSKRLDWLLEKAGELGAAGLRAVRFERSVAGDSAFNDAKKQRWQRRLISAGKQSGRNHLPQLLPPMELADFLSAAGTDLLLLGDAGKEARPVSSVKPQSDQGVSILVGPEGGLTEEEFQRCTGAGYLPVRLGGGTLRTETAAIALLAAVVAIAEQ
ncbi:MAG: RsmE family RNA methyltransferase [Phycisphaerae bacterium]